MLRYYASGKKKENPPSLKKR